jgi:hypothetical protein
MVAKIAHEEYKEDPSPRGFADGSLSIFAPADESVGIVFVVNILLAVGLLIGSSLDFLSREFTHLHPFMWVS